MASLVSSLKRKLASILPFFYATNDPDAEEAEVGSVSKAGDDRPRKRQRLHTDDNDDAADDDDDTSQTTPHLPRSTSWFTTPSLVRESIAVVDSNKEANIIDHNTTSKNRSTQPSALLRLLPHDVLSHCFSYVNTPSDRFGLQVTCTTFRKLSNKEEMLANLELGGNSSSAAAVTNIYSPLDVLEEEENVVPGVGGRGNDDDGNVRRMAARNGMEPEAEAAEGEAADGNNDQANILRRVMAHQAWPLANGGIILDSDSSDTACAKLVKFAAAGNMQATYMIAMILCYCHENISEGLALLRHAAETSTHLPSIYALALILRDSRQIESDYYLNVAASLGYAPAWQEKLTAAEMRAQFGDLDANHLVRYLDPPCLNRLLGRHYLECQRVRKCQTSHCWNPLCGRWAYKALRVENVRQQQHRRGGARQLIARFNARLDELGAGNPNIDDRHLGADNDGARNHDVFEPANANDIGGNHPPGAAAGGFCERHQPCQERPVFSIESLLLEMPAKKTTTPRTADSSELSPLERLRQALRNKPRLGGHGLKVSRMKMCSSCRRAKYCSKLCQVYDWRSGRHKMECQFL